MKKINELKKGDCVYYINKYAMRIIVVKEVAFGLSGATITTIEDETYQVIFISDITGKVNADDDACITTDMMTGRILEIEYATKFITELSNQIEFVSSRISHAIKEIESL